jgi:hypothetical protein
VRIWPALKLRIDFGDQPTRHFGFIPACWNRKGFEGCPVNRRMMATLCALSSIPAVREYRCMTGGREKAQETQKRQSHEADCDLIFAPFASLCGYLIQALQPRAAVPHFAITSRHNRALHPLGFAASVLLDGKIPLR